MTQETETPKRGRPSKGRTTVTLRMDVEILHVLRVLTSERQLKNRTSTISMADVLNDVLRQALRKHPLIQDAERMKK